MTTPTLDRERLRAKARSLGFDRVGIAPAEGRERWRAALREWAGSGAAGDMDWMDRRIDERADPRALWPPARSVVCLAMNYGPAHDPLDDLGRDGRATISVYARGRDYHDVVKKRLKALARWMAATTGGGVKVFVDTAPVMEKPLAQRAGVGWQGKHTNLVSREFGSWLFLGEIYTTLALEPDREEEDRCGSCRACQDVCPTGAFPAPYRLDPRRCISYLTIEHKGHIAREFRAAMGNRVYGCDDCLAVCPWNKFASAAREPAFLPRVALDAPRLADLAALDDDSFRALFRGSAVRRIGRDRFVRNVTVALGNASGPTARDAAAARLDDRSPLVRAMAVWAFSRLADAAAFARHRRRRRDAESDAAVRREWDGGEA